MTREQAKKLLGENATDEQVTELLNTFHSEKSDLEKQLTNLQGEVSNLTTANKELEGYKHQIQEMEKEKLSEQEKINLEKEEIAKMKKETAKLLNSTKAKAVLLGAGISEEEAIKLVETIVKDDEASTLASANLLAAQFNSLRENTSKKVRDELANLDIKPTPSNVNPDSNTVATWDDFTKLSPKDQEQFISDHPTEFENL